MISAQTTNTINRFQLVLASASNDEVFKGLTTKEAYFIVKAHKLVASEHFYTFWNDGRDKQILRDILHDHYPPLEYSHKLEDGYPELTDYVTLAQPIFKDVT